MECEYIMHYNKWEEKANEILNVCFNASCNEETDYYPLKGS